MQDLTQGKVGRQIFNYALPMLLGNVFQQMYNIIDSVIVGRYLGKQALAAVGASFPIIFLLISLIIGVSMGVTIVISQYFGAKEMEKVKHSIDTMFIFLFFTSIIISILGIIFSEDIFILIKLPQELLPLAKTYLQIYFAGIIMLFGFNGVAAALRGLGDSKTPLYFLIISTILNIGLDFYFILGLKLGVAGAALATVVSQGVAFILSVIYLNKKHELIRISFFNVKFDWLIFKQSIRIGLPSGMQQAFVALGMIALYAIVNTFGTDTIAAYSVAGRIDSFALLPAMNFSIALTNFVGQNIGAGKLDRVKQGYYATLKMTTIFALVTTILIVIFGHYLVEGFNQDHNVVNIGENYLVIVSSFYVFFSVMFTTNGVLRGAGDTLIPMFITLLSLWFIRIPVSYFLSRHFGPTGIWWGIPIAWFVGMVISYIYYRTGNWKKKSVVKAVIN